MQKGEQGRYDWTFSEFLCKKNSRDGMTRTYLTLFAGIILFTWFFVQWTLAFDFEQTSYILAKISFNMMVI